MQPYPEEFLRQIDEAWQAPFAGWDFSWLEGKYTETDPHWSYKDMARQRMHGIQAMLDMDTGGGEVLASLAPFPAHTWATETWDKNIPVARARLEPMGVKLCVPERDEDLPFEAETFDLILNRHGSYHAGELLRTLKHGGLFLTQQVGGQNQWHLNELLQEHPEFIYSYWTPALAREQLTRAGFEILQTQEDFPEAHFLTIGAVVYNLRIISWQIAGFTPEAYLDKLYAIEQIIQRDGMLVTHAHRFLIEARRS
jgi:SAM-dependent methyltransferase